MAESYIWVTSWDNTLPAAVGLPIYITVNGTAVTTPPAITPAPLSATTSVFYSNVNPATQTPTVATLTVTPAGGTPPYSSTLSNDISWGPVTQVNSLAYSISGFTSSRHATLTVTDSSSPRQTTPPIDVFVPAPQPYPDAYLQIAVLGRVSAVESLAASLCPAGTGACGVRNDIQTRLFGNLNPTLYARLVNLASQLQATHLTNRATARSAINSLHSSAKTVQSATPAQLSALQSSYASEASLPAEYQSSVAALFGAGFSGYDGNAWTLLGGDLSDCDPYFGCDPCDPSYDECAVGQDYGNAVAYADTQIVIDAATGSYQAFTEESVALGSGALAADRGVCVSVSVNIGTPYGNPTQPVCNTFGYSISEIYGVATQTGTYVATGTTLDYDPCIGVSGACSAPVEVPPLTTRDIADFNPVACSPPTISSILVNSGSGPQPVSELPIGSSGTITILGACLDSTTQVSVGFDPSSDYAGSSTGVTITGNGAGTPTGWGEINAQYNVASGTMPETVVLTVSTSSGSATANLDVVTSGPYIDLINPVTWLSNTPSTTVTISGSGFGTNQGSLAVSAPAGDVSLVNIQSWSDSQIVVNVSTGPNSAGETVTITVTGGVDYGLATGFQQVSGPGSGKNAAGQAYVAPNNCQDSRNALIFEYEVYQSDLQPTCASFVALTMVVPGTPVLNVPSGSTTVPISFLNWSWYSWAIVVPALTTGLNEILADDVALSGPATVLGITSAYRNPEKEYPLSGSKVPVTSRHVHGDAADLDSKKDDDVWQALFIVVQDALSEDLSISGINHCIEPMAKPKNPPPGTPISSSYSTNSHDARGLAFRWLSDSVVTVRYLC